MEVLRSVVRGVLEVVFPPICSACGAPLGDEAEPLCGDCSASFTPVGKPACIRCGASTRKAGTGRCSACPKGTLHFDAARAAFQYRGTFAALYRSFKYDGHVEIGEMLGRRMFAALREDLEEEPRLDVVVPVPLHVVRRLRRGFNQSEEIARELARLAGVPCEADALMRVRRTSQQALQTPERRRENVRGAFEARRPQAVAGRRVGLIDDVLTSGATLNECARVLKEAGAVWVEVLALARA